VRILRLSHSGDFYPGVPEEVRSAQITARAVEAATGQAVETTSRRLWPAPELPGLIDAWIPRYKPDVVIFWANSYWFTWAKVGKAPQFGRPVKRAAARPAGSGRLKRAIVQRVARARRQFLIWRGAGREFFEPEEVIALNETIVRRILCHREVSLIVRGAEWAPLYTVRRRKPGPPTVTRFNRSRHARAEARRLLVHRALESLCEQLHVPYFGAEDGIAYIREGYLCDDGLHSNAQNHVRMAAEETEAILTIWNTLGGNRAESQVSGQGTTGLGRGAERRP